MVRLRQWLSDEQHFVFVQQNDFMLEYEVNRRLRFEIYLRVKTALAGCGVDVCCDGEILSNILVTLELKMFWRAIFPHKNVSFCLKKKS